MSSNDESLTLKLGEDGVAELVIDVVDDTVNTLKANFVERLSRLLDEVESNRGISALVISSGKPSSFLAGADIHMLKGAHDAEALVRLSKSGQAVLDRLERLALPTLAAIHGPCLGGGLELALACRVRVCSSDPKTRLGLPEVQLGLLPGLGGTQRLPRQIGVQAALDLMLTGRQIDSRKSKQLGLVDEVVPASILSSVARGLARELAKEPEKRRTLDALKGLFDREELTELALAENPIGRRVLFDQAKKRLLSKTHGKYPAPERILEVVKLGLERGARAGMQAESEAFGELGSSSVAGQLMQIFFLTQELKKRTHVSDPGVEPRELTRVQVIGAGLMGAGIAHITVTKAELPVRLKDKDSAGLSRGLKYIADLFEESVERGRMTKFEALRSMNCITATTDASGLSGAELVIEAVFEDLELKRAVLAEVEQHGQPQVIFGTNTSSLPIGAIAAHARHPERVIGMHYFSPVHRMPLLELVTTRATAPWVTRTVAEFGKRQGKTVIVVSDGPGFFTSRVLGPYLNEALWLVAEGVSVDKVDRALEAFGFPVGPVALLDEIGVDVAGKVAGTLEQAFGGRLKPPALTRKLLEDGRLGRKTARGFYQYNETSSKGRRQVDPLVYGVLDVAPHAELAPDEIVERCVLAMLNEAVRCLDEGVLHSAADGDIGAIYGLGFPPYLGGPFRYADALGASEMLARLTRLEANLGERFRVAEPFRRMAAAGTRFHDSAPKVPR